MLRYNHRLIEREILRKRTQTSADGPGGVCVLPIPGAAGCLDLENARLLILADFFSLINSSAGRPVYWLPTTNSRFPREFERLGMPLSIMPPDGTCRLAIIPRDFSHLFPQSLSCEEKILCGRLLGVACFEELVVDFGVDALRVYFLYLGPLQGDYQFCWHRLAAAYRFLERVWRLAQNPRVEQHRSLRELQLLESAVQMRLQQKKPHTALAAVMGFLKGKKTLASREVAVVAGLLKPYAPFLAADMLKCDAGGGPR